MINFDEPIDEGDGINNSFIIVARALEEMALNPTEGEIKLMLKIAGLIAMEQSFELRKSKYPGVYYNRAGMRYEAYTHTDKGTKKVVIHSSDSEEECYQKLLEHKGKKDEAFERSKALALKTNPNRKSKIMHDDKGMKAVDKLDMKGNFIETYHSVQIAAIKNNTHAANISACLTGRTTTHGGFKWRYAK